jgi:hypothetical protein
MSLTTSGASAIVEIWERGRHEHPVDRALTILTVLSQRSRGDLAELSLESRDILLLECRRRIFGNHLSAWVACPRCNCGVDVSLSADDVEAPEDRFDVVTAGRTLSVRMPTSLDLAAAAECQTVEAIREVLFERCACWGEHGDVVGIDMASQGEIRAAVEAELDRRAGISGGVVALSCPDCQENWEVELDVAAFAWREIELLAGRLLRDVDVLARRYGWSEEQILSLSSDRRSFYLELAS